MQTYKLTGSNNEVWRFTRDLSSWAAVYDLSTAVVEMEFYAPGGSSPALTLSTGDGSITIDPTTHIAIFAKPVSDIADLLGEYRGDCRLTLPNTASVDMFKATLTMKRGFTRDAVDDTSTAVTGPGDTVTVVLVEDGDSELVTLPASLTAVLSMTTLARDDAEAAASAAASSESAAASHQAAAASSLAAFLRIYLGAFATDPALDDAGGALAEGAFYLNTVSGKLRVRHSNAWVDYDKAAQDASSSASSSASAANTSAGNAHTSETNAASTLHTFLTQYLGSHASDPTVDGNGGALGAGAIYFSSVSSKFRVYSGSAWADYDATAQTAASTATTQAGIATTQAGIATTQAGNAASSANAVSLLLLAFRQVFAGDFANDAACDAFLTANSITKTDGLQYYNTTEHNGRIWNATAVAWQEVDADAQTQRSNAAASALAAAGSAASALTSLNTFLANYIGAFAVDPTVDGAGAALTAKALYVNTVSGKLRTYATGAWVDYDAAAQTAASTATGALSSIRAFWCGAAAADPTTDGNGNALTAGCIYFNTGTNKLRTHVSGAWVDYDKTAQDALTAATAQATAAAGSATAAAGSATTAANTNAAVTALYNSTSSLAISASMAAASAAAASNQAVLTAAQRAIFLATDLADVCLYDTTRDSDGGAWVKKTQALSYYNETLNTAYRGARQDTPSMWAILGSVANQLQINDGQDVTSPMWMKFPSPGNSAIIGEGIVAGTSIDAGEGMVVVTQANRLAVIDFATDTAGCFYNGANANTGNYKGAIATRSSQAGYDGVASPFGFTGQATAAATLYDVSIGVRPTSAVAPNRLGLRYPIIAIGGAGGLSLIDFETKQIYNSAETTAFKGVCIRDGKIWSHDGTSYFCCDIPTATGFRAKAVTFANSGGDVPTLAGTIPTGYCEPDALIRNGGVTFTKRPAQAANQFPGLDARNTLVADLTTTYFTGWKGRGCVLSLAESSACVANMVAGELCSVTSAFPDATGFSGFNMSVAASGGNLVATSNGTSYGNFGYAVTTVVGKTYLAKVTAAKSANGVPVYLYAANVSSDGSIITSQATISASSQTQYLFVFTATQTTTYISLQAIGAISNGDTITLSAISCKEVATDRSQPGAVGNSLSVVGTVGRSVVATGADLAGYNGWGVGNYLVGPAIAFGSSDFDIPISIVNANVTGTHVYWSQGYYTGGAYSGARVQLYTNATDIYLYVSDGTNTGQILVSGAIASGNNYHVRAAYRSASNSFELWINSVRVGVTLRGSVGSLTNVNANMFVGIDPALANPVNSATILTLFKPALSSLSPDDIRSIYADELPLFQPNAKFLLPSLNCQSVARDPDTRRIIIGTDAGTPIYSGFVQTGVQKSTLAANRFHNTQLTGAVAGTPGTLPTGFSLGSLPSGVTRTVVGSGFVNGCAYVDLQFSGTPGANGAISIYLDTSLTTQALAASGQTWTLAVGLALTAGAMANIASPVVQIVERDASTNGLANSTASLSAITGSVQAFSVTRAFNQAATAFADGLLSFGLTNGQAVNLTLRITQPYIAKVSSFTAYTDGLSGSDNHKYVAASSGQYAIVTANGVDWFAPAVNLRENLTKKLAALQLPISQVDKLTASVQAIIGATDVTAMTFYSRTDDVMLPGAPDWRDCCAGKSWENETLGTTTRGSTRKFPKLALIVGRTAVANSLTIYDATDPACPMWMLFQGNGNNPIGATTSYPINSIAAINGTIYAAMGGYGCSQIDFISDFSLQRGGATPYIWPGVVNRNLAVASASYPTTAFGQIANSTTNDVAATVLPLTPPNPNRLGLPNPTVAVATNGGVSVIRSDGVVCSSTAAAFYSVSFDAANGNLNTLSATSLMTFAPSLYQTASWSWSNSIAAFSQSQLLVGNNTNSKVRAIGKNKVVVAGSTGLATVMYDPTNPANSLISVKTATYETGFMPGAQGAIKFAMAESSADVSSLVDLGDLLANGNFGTGDYTGWTLTGNGSVAVAANVATITQGASGQTMLSQTVTTVVGRRYALSFIGCNANCYIRVGSGGVNTSDLVTATNGTVLSGAATFVATTTSTTVTLLNSGAASSTATFGKLSVRSGVADRSGTANHAIVTGTLTRSPVAPGADIAAIGGFSASNFMETAAGAVDFASADWCMMGWVNPASNSSYAPIWRGYYTAGAWSGAYEGLYIYSSTGYVGIYSSTDGVTQDNPISTVGLAQNAWSHIVGLRRGNTLEIYINGVKVKSAAMTNSSGSHTNANATVRLGLAQSGSNALNGSLAQVRVAAIAPTPDQIAAIYAAEAPLFQAGAKALLPSATVQAIAVDPMTNKVIVGTAAGTAILEGIQTVDTRTAAQSFSLSNDNVKAVAASSGHIAIASAQEAVVEFPNVELRGHLATRRMPPAFYDPTRGDGSGKTTDATPTVIGNIIVPEGKAGYFRVIGGASQVGGTTTEQDVFQIIGYASRNIGGHAVVSATTTAGPQVTGTTSLAAAQDQTNDTIKLTAIGKNATTLNWTWRFEWLDSGLMAAA